jgi:hypothetical protein
VLANGPDEQPDGRQTVKALGRGQILIAGWGSIQPAIEARRARKELGLYVDVFLAAVYPAGAGRVVAIVPGEEVALPAAEPMPVEELIRRLPAHSMMMSDAELPRGPQRGTAETYAWVMATWERLHAPFLAAAEAMGDPIRRIEAYRQTIAVDYACEPAHQRISDTARKLCAKGTS